MDRTAESPFSSEYRLLDDRKGAAKFVCDVIRAMNRERPRRWLPILWPVAEAMIAEGPNTHNDRREVQQLLSDRGFLRVRVRDTSA